MNGKTVKKIRPDKEFYKEYLGGTYHTIYEADEVEQLASSVMGDTILMNHIRTGTKEKTEDITLQAYL